MLLSMRFRGGSKRSAMWKTPYHYPIKCYTPMDSALACIFTSFCPLPFHAQFLLFVILIPRVGTLPEIAFERQLPRQPLFHQRRQVRQHVLHAGEGLAGETAVPQGSQLGHISLDIGVKRHGVLLPM